MTSSSRDDAPTGPENPRGPAGPDAPAPPGSPMRADAPEGGTSPGGPDEPQKPGQPEQPDSGPATVPTSTLQDGGVPRTESQPAEPTSDGKIHARTQAEQVNEEMQEENAETSLDQPSDGGGEG